MLSDRVPNTLVVAGPVFGVAGELNAAARIIAEAEMEGPSPPFSSWRQAIHFCKNPGGQTMLQRKEVRRDSA